MSRGRSADPCARRCSPCGSTPRGEVVDAHSGGRRPPDIDRSPHPGCDRSIHFPVGTGASPFSRCARALRWTVWTHRGWARRIGTSALIVVVVGCGGPTPQPPTSRPGGLEAPSAQPAAAHARRWAGSRRHHRIRPRRRIHPRSPWSRSSDSGRGRPICRAPTSTPPWAGPGATGACSWQACCPAPRHRRRPRSAGRSTAIQGRSAYSRPTR